MRRKEIIINIVIVVKIAVTMLLLCCVCHQFNSRDERQSKSAFYSWYPKTEVTSCDSNATTKTSRQTNANSRRIYMLYGVPQTKFQHTINVSMSDIRGVALFIMAESESVQANTEHK